MIFKQLQLVAMFILAIFFIYSYYMQMNGDMDLRVKCWKEGGILWHTLNQEKICIHLPQQSLKNL